MNVFVGTEQRFVTAADGSVLTENEHSSGYAFFRRYLQVFDSVTVIGRSVSGAGTGLRPVTGPGIRFAAVPHYLGPWEYLQKATAIKRTLATLWQQQTSPSALIARCPGKISALMIKQLKADRFPYGMEVVSDPFEAFRPGAIKHPLRPLFRYWFPRSLQRQCLGACAISYVTEAALQRRYPAAPGVFQTFYSSVVLDSAAIAAKPKTVFAAKKEHRLVFVGSLAQMYKGVDVLIRAVAICAAEGWNIRVDLLGDGKHRVLLESLAVEEGVGDRFAFHGLVPSGTAVRNYLDQADLFVLPSLGEGLPRAMIEAMARALPCIGTDVGGVAELLPDEDRVRPGSAGALAAKLKEVLADPERQERMSARNLARARQYESGILEQRRVAFYQEVKDRTCEHLARRQEGRVPA